MTLPEELMEILRCPVCHGRLSAEGEELVCEDCSRHYPVRDGIPHMLPEEARGGPEGESDE
jgi:uncharacterized protein YbaR (Trm112 family)